MISSLWMTTKTRLAHPHRISMDPSTRNRSTRTLAPKMWPSVTCRVYEAQVTYQARRTLNAQHGRLPCDLSHSQSSSSSSATKQHHRRLACRSWVNTTANWTRMMMTRFRGTVYSSNACGRRLRQAEESRGIARSGQRCVVQIQRCVSMCARRSL